MALEDNEEVAVRQKREITLKKNPNVRNIFRWEVRVEGLHNRKRNHAKRAIQAS